MPDTRDDRERLYLDYRDKVRRYFSGRITDPQEVEDLTSTVFLKVYQSYDSFEESKASRSTWIYTIARNTLYDHYRRAKPTEPLPEDLQTGEELEADLLRAETLRELADALSHLGQRERDLILLHYYKLHTLKEVAELMGVSYATAKNIHQRGLDQLKRRMTGPKVIPLGGRGPGL